MRIQKRVKNGVSGWGVTFQVKVLLHRNCARWREDISPLRPFERVLVLTGVVATTLERLALEMFAFAHGIDRDVPWLHAQKTQNQSWRSQRT